jgi:hypothetical protein
MDDVFLMDNNVFASDDEKRGEVDNYMFRNVIKLMGVPAHGGSIQVLKSMAQQTGLRTKDDYLLNYAQRYANSLTVGPWKTSEYGKDP